MNFRNLDDTDHRVIETMRKGRKYWVSFAPSVDSSTARIGSILSGKLILPKMQQSDLKSNDK
ncbi:hypothetical protein [Alicyclobacillus fodiniaquatilis]|uniref:Uncharacterized protein n=1 Tax=Alicyclobacillus fodiniaquatilis TaxID=1661150 RepID=A0ABW4JCQ4_9BACL